MAVLALGLAGTAAGSWLLPGGLFGGLISGGALGGLIGSLAGRFVDQMLFPQVIRGEGPRLQDLKVQASTEGAPILRVYGFMRIGPQVIWATQFREVVSEEESGGGKGIGGGPKTVTTTYKYFVSFAIGLCEGPIKGVLSVWADGKLLDLSEYTTRTYLGTEAQAPDPKIEAVEGTGNAPAYRGLAYMVFEEMPLEKFGNRVPQITVEVLRDVPGDGDTIEALLTAVTLIPGSTEFGYDTQTTFKVDGIGSTQAENSNSGRGGTDLQVSLNQLAILAPNVSRVSIVIAWHGSDLRCGHCTIKPKVEVAAKETQPGEWSVSGVDRSGAEVVSQAGGGPAIGGAPSDASVYRAIEELQARGHEVTFYPFLMMDIPAGNALPDPWTGGGSQPPYPWRGRITCDHAPGRPGTVDKTAAAATQVAAFFGTCTAAHFSWNPATMTVDYSGPAEWSLRRQVLHYATLVAAAGGVAAFIIGSELVGLTTVRSGASTYPAVTALKTLAADVKAIVGAGCKVSYAADWTEYNNHRPADGSGDIFFHLDPLWSDANIDFVAIDNYFPLADWRDGAAHLDALAGARSQYDLDYLRDNVEGGELYDWFYASPAARDAQTRTTIADGAYNEPWVHRYKDVRNWWLNAHHNRPAGVRSATPTAWAAQSKPVRFTELGCPAVDKGANQPNVFYDPKSSESHLPYYSTGRRDDLAQRAYLEAVLTYWHPSAGNNPVSAVYGGRMIDRDRIAVWTWDARPYPDFPLRPSVWLDSANWRLGHWLTGRLGAVPLRLLIEDVCSGLGVTIDASQLNAMVRGYTIDQVMSARESIDPLRSVYFFDGFQSDNAVRFKHRDSAPVATFTADDLVDGGAESSIFTLTRGQESELPRSAKLHYVDLESEYRPAAAESRRLKGSSARVVEPSIAAAFDAPQAQGIVDAMLIEAHVARERAAFTLPPSALAYDPSDIVALEANGRSYTFRIDALGVEHARTVRGVRTDADVYRLVDGAAGGRSLPPVAVLAAPVLEFLDLPLLTGAEVPHAPHIAAYAKPWGAIAVRRAPAIGSTYAFDVMLPAPTLLGKLVDPLPRGTLYRWDSVNPIVVEVPPGEILASLDELAVLAGANAAAIMTPSGEWEIVQWRDAELVATNRYRLTTLLRGQRGTEHAMGNPTPAGARFVRLASSLRQSTMPASLRNLPQAWKWGPAARPIDDPTWTEQVRTFVGLGLRPFSPTHVRAARDAGTGDLVLSWTRRTRVGGGDDWEAVDVPLGEETEAYEVDVYSGANVVRVLSSSTPSVVYTAAQQFADFGATQISVDVAVFQMSVSFGRGVGARGIVNA